MIEQRRNELTIEVLDCGFVRLVDWMGDDLSIVQAARVSYGEGSKGEEQDRKLIRYLLQNNHTSPFEQVQLKFHVKAPIFVFRQWHRHRTWCLAGNNPIIFSRPCDGRSYRLSLEDIVSKWTPKTAKRQRGPRSLETYNRERLSAMSMRAPGGDVHLQDAWFSGEKPVFSVKTAHGIVAASANHVFKTPDGPRRLVDGLQDVMVMVPRGQSQTNSFPAYSHNELVNEIWVEVYDGYEVSNLGRVRSYWRQGQRQKSRTPILKKLTVNNNGRVVVSIKNVATSVSRLVAEAFLDESLTNVQVLHANDNPLDNRVSNLYIGSPLDNAHDQYVNGGRVCLREVPAKIISVTACGIVPTFDLTVSGNHWFTVDNVVVHNSYNEISARYTEVKDEFYIPEGWRKQDNKNKQASTQEYIHAHTVWYQDICREALAHYHEIINKGGSRELARIVLPQSMYSEMYASVNLHNLLRFITLRDDPHAQWEIQQYAKALKELARHVCPVTLEIWDDQQTP